MNMREASKTFTAVQRIESVMNRYTKLELARYRTVWPTVAFSSSASLLVALYFFTIVGRFDDSEDNDMFRSYGGVIALALTVTFCVVAIHATAIYARTIVADYVGNRRLQLYGYPDGREPLFHAKNLAFAIATFAATAIGLVTAFGVFLLAERYAPLIASKNSSLLGYLPLLAAVPLLTLGATIIAGAIGVWRRSVISAIIAVVILVSALGNSVAISLISSPLITLGVSVVGIVAAIALVVATSQRIRKDDLM